MRSTTSLGFMAVAFEETERPGRPDRVEAAPRSTDNRPLGLLVDPATRGGMTDAFAIFDGSNLEGGYSGK